MLPTDSGVSSDRMQWPGKFVNLLREKISEDAFAGNQMIRHRRERVSSAYEKTAKKKYLNYAFARRGTRLAEMERFELSNSFPSYTISNRAPSTGLGDISVFNIKF